MYSRKPTFNHNNTLYLVYGVEFDKIDYKSAIIKRNLDFSRIIETKPIYINEQVKDLFETR